MGLAFQAIYPVVYPVAYQLFQSGMKREKVTVKIFMEFGTLFYAPERRIDVEMIELSIKCAENDYNNGLNLGTSGREAEDKWISRSLGNPIKDEKIKKRAFRNIEKEKIEALIKSGWLNCDAGNGTFGGHIYPFVLVNGDNNIYEPILNDVKFYFTENNIAWWKGKEPTGHALSSQIACINHLFPLRNDKEAVLALLSLLPMKFVDVLKINSDKFAPAFISFEQISDNDLLNEGIPSRGTNCTSIDACIYAVHENGLKYIVPIEWKYTETYQNEDKGAGSSGETRHKRYDGLIEESLQLKNGEKCYYFEPFYQLMRQTLWAEQMVKNKNSETIKADDYIHLHIIPYKNIDMLEKRYSCSNLNMCCTWRECLMNQDKYKIISPETLFKNINNKYNDLIEYLSKRYWEDFE